MKKQILLPFVLLGAAGLITSLGACQPRSQEEKPEEGYGVAITNKDALNETWYAGTSRALDIELTPAGNVMQEYTTGALKIESSNPDVVSITGANANGLAEGQATVTVKYHGWKDTVDLTISRKQTNKEKFGTQHEGTAEDPFDNEDAVKVGKWAKDNGNTEPLYVKGEIASFYHAPGSRDDGAVSWFLKPAEGQTEKFEVYKCYKATGTGAEKNLKDSDVWVGGIATAYGPITYYADGNQAEFTGSTFVSCEGEPPAERQTISATFAEALAAGKALDDGGDTYDYYQFDAYVTKQSGTNYFLTATKGEAITNEKDNTIEIYKATATGLADKLLKNAKVTVKMVIKNYHDQVENSLALAAADVTVVEAGVPWVVPEHNVTVAEAITACNALADGATSEDLYNLSEVYVTEVTYAFSNGTMSFKVADTADGTNTLTVYKAATDATTAAKVVAGAQVTIKGNLQKYVKNSNVTPELVNVASITVKDSGGGGGDQQTNVIDLTAQSLLGYTGTQIAYKDGTATVGGVAFSYIELGAYGNGMQMRVKNGKSSTILNTAAFGSAIEKIEITLNADKQVYDNTDVWAFDFGTSSAVDGEQIKLSTVADTKSYTVTPVGTNYTFFKMTKIIESYSFYVDSVKITLASAE